MDNNYIKVLIVDDSAFMRKMITDMIQSDEHLQVVGTARNGEEALSKIESLQPDVITLDVEMPKMDGITTLKEIMRTSPLPVIMLSSLTHVGTTETIKALELGAFDFIGKPSGPISLDIEKIKAELIEKIHLASASKNRILKLPRMSIKDKVLTKPPDINYKSKKIEEKNMTMNTSKVDTIIAIGTSTGGPRALQNVITKLPKDIQASIVIVQHMPQGFTKSLAERLDSISEIKVFEAEDKMILQNGCAYLAPGAHQMSISQNRNGEYQIRIDIEAEPYSGHKPSVDYLFLSIAELLPMKKIVVIMTGMGGDGSKGLVAIKQKSAYAIAEDESTCVVFGMPRVAIATGLIDDIVPLEKIASEIIKHAKN
ncbi:hypothetical protein BHU72_03400 [Desulfuribacillus stibiiarsenatis]|uniref:Protein-glutamate methylesterase/protein-glutamine glutaminase n=1 Tax=Desulfuribacillus stibiiarsenatis TaxID=1390249 RepID=A0A1E5L774_9FIRM|nr:chemotaxis response regulator protein-glutamate methylesterase [Desulfuribacillus stibiiarsenatis]OEH85839.1 hypothetical protein BHU72_03400 [Desulfuribacillus stibiiarsenatis]